MKSKSFFLSLILFLLTYFSWANNNEGIPVTAVEYQALVDFYNKTGGDNWSNKWDISSNNIHEGSWYGVSVENGHITEINLRNNKVNGAIPASFGNLKYLRKLDLYGYYNSNNLSTTDLNNLSELESLEYLDLSYCYLSGNLPESWSKLTQLQTLTINNNTLEGGIFEGLGELKLLKTLNLQSNKFTAIPASLGKLGNLKTLNISSNNITGSLPKVFEELTSLTSLNLQYNQLSGIDAFLPSTVYLNVGYQTISLASLVYKGNDIVLNDVPEITQYNRSTNDFSSRPNFRLYIRGTNVLTITMAEDGSLTLPLEYLSSLRQGDDVYLYQYSGTSNRTRINFDTITLDLPAVPDEEYQALVDFYNSTGGENWTHNWPVETNNLNEGSWYGVSLENGHVTEINLRSNKVKGAIPTSFGNLKHLRKLDLYGYYNSNDLTSTDLNNLSELESLEYLDLSYCSLSGNLPESWSKLTQLKTLTLNNNALEGDVFNGVGELKLLNTLNLQTNKFTGIPASIGQLSNLKTLNIYSNSITGSLPKTLEELTSLTSLNAQYNQLSGIDAFLPSTVYLNVGYQTISLASLEYKGSDVVLNELPEITKYNRSTNDFSSRPNFKLYIRGTNVLTITMAADGSLTLPLEYLSSLKQGDDVYLYQYSGTSNRTRINFDTITLDLPAVPDAEYQALVDFYNSTGGENWTHNWPIESNNLNEGAWYGVSVENGHITEINLRSNKVKGSIPASFGNLKYLRKLDLYGYYNSNDLSTTDLNNLSALESLEYLDLSYCSLSGNLPESWSNLTHLQTLTLNNNTLEGVIFKGIGELKLLHTLNLQSNKFSGIPVGVMQLSSLKTLNMQNNQLSEVAVFLPSTVYLDVSYQTINLASLVYKGNDIVLNDVPEITKYNRSTNDFSSRPNFRLYIRGTNVLTITMAEDGSLTLPIEYLSSLQQGDDVYLYQYSGTSNRTRINFDTIILDLPAVPDDEYQALVDFYNSTGGENWTHKWPIESNNLNEGAWYGVSIENGHITAINLRSNKVKGAIPASFSNLKYLRKLDLYGYYNSNNLSTNDLNNLSGLESLEYLDLSYCFLLGDISASWSKLTKLQTLILNNNTLENIDESFIGLTPNSLSFQYQYVTIESVEVNGDKITIELPRYMVLQIEEDVLNYNANNEFRLYVNGVKEKAAFSNNGTLVFSDISLLGLKETDQIRIYQETGIAKYSEIYYNSVNFGSPLVNEEFEILKKIYKESNGENWKNTWDVSANTVHQIAWFGVSIKDGHVIGLNLFNNNLTGTISEEITGLSYLENLNFAGNNLTGTLPENLELLSKLEVFDVSSNKLSGAISSKIADLKFLKKFAIGDNEFTGSIPSVLSDFEVLEHLDISSNGFDNIEKKLYYDFSTTYIDLREQKIVYDIILNLSDNELDVTLPDIVKYNLEENNFDAKNSFSLLVNNLTHDTAVLNDEGKVVFKNVRIGEISNDAIISIRQTTGSFLNTEFYFTGIEDKSNVPVDEEEYLALVRFYEELNGTDWIHKWDTTLNRLHTNPWFGVTTYDGHIIGLDLSNNNLSGSISAVLDKLPYLTELNVSSNKIKGIDAVLPSSLRLSIDRQNQNMGVLNLSRSATIRDNSLNRYNHQQRGFVNQTYYLTIGSFSKTINLPEEGIKLIDLISNWKIPNGQKATLRQKSGDAINSVIDFEVNFKKGDANIDDAINVLDIQTTINHILSDKTTYFNFYGADISDDGFVNILDVIGQVNAIQNKSKSKQAIKTLTSNNLKDSNTSLIGISDGNLIIDPNGYHITSFEIVLEDIAEKEIKEMISALDFNTYISQTENQVSIIGFSLNNSLNIQTTLASINNTNATIVSVLLSNKEANEIPWKIAPKETLSANDISEIEKMKLSSIKNYPNPFVDKTIIEFYLEKKYENTTVLLFDVTGKKVLEEPITSAVKGKNTYTFIRGNSIPSGTYFYIVKLSSWPTDKFLKGKMIIE